MKSNTTQNAPRGGYGRRQGMEPGGAVPLGPIINWAALWTRLWLFLKRLVAEVWYLVSRRQPQQSATTNYRRYQTEPQGRSLLLFRKWSLPLFKVAAALVLFFYVMQRDIQFSIQMKAPLGQLVAANEATGDSRTETMGFVQSVAFGGAGHNQSQEVAPATAQVVEDYLERFAAVAQAEMTKYGIPASISMAQAILESNAGQSVAARVDKNHFGAPLAGQPYESAWRNWREHSLLLVNRFGQLRKLGNDYRSWARGLEKAGYSKQDHYANKLLEIIDRFHLEQLDDPTI